MHENHSEARRRNAWVIALAVLMVAVGVAAVIVAWPTMIEWVSALVAGLPPLAPATVLLALLIMILWSTFLPPMLLQVALAAWAGFWWGAVIAWVGAGLATYCGWLLGRYAVASKVDHWLQQRPKMQALAEALALSGLRGVILLRLAGVIPSPAVGPVLAVTAMPVHQVILGSAIGKIPGVLLAAAVGAGLMRESWGPQALVAVLASIVLLIVLTRYWQRALVDIAERNTTVNL